MRSKWCVLARRFSFGVACTRAEPHTSNSKGAGPPKTAGWMVIIDTVKGRRGLSCVCALINCYTAPREAHFGAKDHRVATCFSGSSANCSVQPFFHEVKLAIAHFVDDAVFLAQISC